MLLGTVLLLFQAAFSFSHALAAPTASAPTPAPSGKVIMLVIDALPVDDFVSPEWINLRKIAAHGVIGLMNARTSATPNFASAAAHLTIGARARAPAGLLSGYAFDTSGSHNGVPVTELYAATTGNEAGNSAIVVLGLPQLQAAAAIQPELGARPGALGQAIAASGGRSAVIGNADVPDALSSAPDISARPEPGSAGIPVFILRRHAALIAMDERGQIALGSVGPQLLTYDEQWPFGWRTDYEAVWDALTAIHAEADFIVIELGDFARLDALNDWIAPERMSALRRGTINRIDEFIGRLIGSPAAAGADLVVVSPSPPTAALRRNFMLTPLMWTHIDDPPFDDPGAPSMSRPITNPSGPVSSPFVSSPSDTMSSAASPALATSRTTRRVGIVTNTDIPPTVLAALQSVGDLSSAPQNRLIQATPGEHITRDLPPTIAVPADNWQTVALLYERATLTHSLRAPVVQTFVSAAIAVFVAWVAWMIYINIAAVTVPRHALHVWRWLMLLLSAAPLAMLVLPLFPVNDITEAALALLLLTGVFALLAHVVGKATGKNGLGNNSDGASPSADRSSGGLELEEELMDVAGDRVPVMDAFVCLSILTAFALVLDVAVGARLIKSSVLGYDPIVGARYYGIGNEYMGVLIGTTLVGTTGLLDRLASRRGLTAVLASYVIVGVTLASPALGANVGGTIAAVIGLGLTAALLLGKRLTWKTVLLVGSALIVVLMAAAAFDLLFRQGQLSHVGQTVQLVQRHGLQPLADIVVRKLRMNAKLLRWTIWVQVFIVSLAVSTLALYRPAITVRRIERHHPMLLHGIRGAVIAAIVALVANDSGVVAAATMMIPVTATLMYLVLLQRA